MRKKITAPKQTHITSAELSALFNKAHPRRKRPATWHDVIVWASDNQGRFLFSSDGRIYLKETVSHTAPSMSGKTRLLPLTCHTSGQLRKRRNNHAGL